MCIRDRLPTAHPLFVPLPVGRDLWTTADVVIGIGTRLEWPLGRWGIDTDLRLVKIDVDPEELDRHGATTIGPWPSAATSRRHTAPASPHSPMVVAP